MPNCTNVTMAARIAIVGGLNMDLVVRSPLPGWAPSPLCRIARRWSGCWPLCLQHELDLDQSRGQGYNGMGNGLRISRRVVRQTKGCDR
jgi:hypothetical protein